MARPTGIPSRSIPLRLTPPVLARVRAAAQRLGLSDQDVIRMAMGVGLEALRRVDYDLAALICDASGIVRVEPEETLKAAETPPPYGGKKKKNG